MILNAHFIIELMEVVFNSTVMKFIYKIQYKILNFKGAAVEKGKNYLSIKNYWYLLAVLSVIGY